jgi:GNAT superfamily N-acetyltransferase
VVTESAEGRGLGRALLEAAEEWARRQGYAHVTLNVFAANQAARGLYEHLGYRPEQVRYRKELRQDGAAPGA